MANIPQSWLPVLVPPMRWWPARWFHKVYINFEDDVLVKNKYFFGDESCALGLISTVSISTNWRDVLLGLQTKSMKITTRDDSLPVIHLYCLKRSPALNKLRNILVSYTSQNMLKLE